MAGSPTAIGTNVVTSISRQYIMPTVVDNCYNSNPVFFRINKSKRFIKGGTQIEVPLMYARFTNGGAYEGLDVLTISPSDTIKNGVWDWRQYYVSIAVDGRTLIKVDSPEAIANFLKLQFAQAEMEMATNLGAGLWGTNTSGAGKEIDGIPQAVDDTLNYGGLAVATNPWWQATKYTGTDNLSLTVLNEKLWSTASEGGRHPSLIVSRQAAYDSYYKLAVSKQNIYQGPISYDEQLFAGGFTNLLFNGVPWTVDPNVTSSSTLGDIYFLNEDYIYWCISPRGDMFVTDFQEGINQDAMVAKILWAGNLVITNRARHSRATALTAAA